MRRQVSPTPAKSGRGKAPGLPLEEGFIEGKKVFWPDCIRNWEGEDVPFLLGHENPVNQEGKITRIPQSLLVGRRGW